MCDFGVSSEYIKYLFGSSFVLVSAESFVEVLWLLWICGVVSLLWCGADSLVPLWQFDWRKFINFSSIWFGYLIFV